MDLFKICFTCLGESVARSVFHIPLAFFCMFLREDTACFLALQGEILVCQAHEIMYWEAKK